MSKKSAAIAALIDGFRGRDLDPHYLGYFACFNQARFYEAHDVLEELWLEDRRGPDGDFYKALIQFAGAFVHLQKDCPRYPRLRPAAALFALARGYLAPYGPAHRGLDVDRVRALAEEWMGRLEAGRFSANPLQVHAPPLLELR